ncbi:MAG: MFS transporter [Acidimicrobiia bacterium]
MRRFPVLDAFREARFRRVWAAGFVSQLGDWMQIFGRAALAYELTGRAESVGLVYFASYLPQLLFSVWGGVLADRFSRRHLLVGTQVAEAAGAALFGVLVATGSASVANVTVVSFFLGIAFMLSIPAGSALLPSVVSRDSLSSAISVGNATNSLARVFGPLLAAGIISWFGLAWVFWVNAVSFLFVIVAWATVELPEQPEIEEEGNMDALRRAVRYVRETPVVAVPIGATAFLMFVGVVYQPFAIVYATRVLSDGSTSLGRTYYSWLQAAIGTGAAIGVFASANVGRRYPAPTFALTAIGFSLALTLLGQVESFGVAMAVILVAGGFHFANMALGVSLVQHEVPEVLRGRVMSIHMLGLVGVIPLTALIGGRLVDHFGIRATFTAAGLSCLAFSLLLLRWRRHIRLREGEPGTLETRAAVALLVEEEG